jgi:hypothetical protein
MALNTNGVIARRTPQPGAEGNNNAQERFTPYGDRTIVSQVPANSRSQLADEGSYYTVCNPTPDTTVACGIITAYVTTTPLFHIANLEQGGGQNITLDFIKLRVTVAPASAVNAIYTIEIDPTPRIATAPTGGINANVRNVNASYPNDFNGQVWAFTGGTVLTIMAGSNPRVIGHGAIAHSIPLVHDELLLLFGQPDGIGTPAAAVTRRVANCPPVVIPPQCSASIFIYFVSNASTGLSAEYELGMWQR